jgi:hypothetical protein
MFPATLKSGPCSWPRGTFNTAPNAAAIVVSGAGSTVKVGH